MAFQKTAIKPHKCKSQKGCTLETTDYNPTGIANSIKKHAGTKKNKKQTERTPTVKVAQSYKNIEKQG